MTYRRPEDEAILYEPDRGNPEWLGKKAMAKIPPPWWSIPRDHPTCLPMAPDREPRSYAGISVLMILLGAVAIWLSWWPQ